jgi:hypothetical protein
LNITFSTRSGLVELLKFEEEGDSAHQNTKNHNTEGVKLKRSSTICVHFCALEDLEAYEGHRLHSVEDTKGVTGSCELESHHLIRVCVYASVTEAPRECHHERNPVVLVVMNLEERNSACNYDRQYVHHTSSS